jgi:hypothetical protein
MRHEIAPVCYFFLSVVDFFDGVFVPDLLVVFFAGALVALPLCSFAVVLFAEDGCFAEGFFSDFLVVDLLAAGFFTAVFAVGFAFSDAAGAVVFVALVGACFGSSLVTTLIGSSFAAAFFPSAAFNMMLSIATRV